MKKCHNYLDELVGSPTQKMTSRAGDVFYINNVAEAIAKVRLACLSCPFNSDITFRIMRIHLHVLWCAIIPRTVARGCHRSLMARKCYSIFRHHGSSSGWNSVLHTWTVTRYFWRLLHPRTFFLCLSACRLRWWQWRIPREFSHEALICAWLGGQRNRGMSSLCTYYDVYVLTALLGWIYC